jgi:hypothetical protein
MCEVCEHPEKLNGVKPGECSAEQIRECHGSVAEHLQEHLRAEAERTDHSEANR